MFAQLDVDRSGELEHEEALALVRLLLPDLPATQVHILHTPLLHASPRNDDPTPSL